MMRADLIFCTLFFMLGTMAIGQHKQQQYFPETDSLVLEKLDEWQDIKFGLLMHWGPYSQKGIVESWSICPEDYGWCQRKKPGDPETYEEYVRAYEDLPKTFNPINFDPEKWATAAADAGMRYVVFTTKHHDGFCMFDTKETDYKITDDSCPYSANDRANITLEIFEAFKKEGLWTGAYFSKPDWHNDDYWWPYFPPQDRNVNYDPKQYPEKWQSFVDFTHNQILELMTHYGDVDILWLDGGWVADYSDSDIQEYYQKQIEENNGGFRKSSIVNQDIKMDELVDKVREKQPGLIVVDRAVEGPNQNYLTPENRVPESELSYPWESCIIAGGGWSYAFNAQYMSGHKSIELLTDIVCKGGNLLLNIAPAPDGTWDKGAYRMLEEIGDWMEINEEAIYETRAIAPYKDGQFRYTNKKNTDIVYAIYMSEENETVPTEVIIKNFTPKKNSKIRLLGYNKPLKWEKNTRGIRVEIPEKLRENPPCNYAWTFKLINTNHE